MKNQAMRFFAKTVVFLPYAFAFGAAGLGILYTITGAPFIETTFSIMVQTGFVLTIVSAIVYVITDAIYGTNHENFE